MNILSATKTYSLSLQPDFSFMEELKNRENAFYVADANVARLYPKLLWGIPEERLFLLDAVEEKKTAETALSILSRMTGIPGKRNAWLVSLGGGIVQDVTGFAANILYRGIRWAFVPTTLLAACDSCIGGKTSLNFGSYKNLLGTFYPPDEIYDCPRFFRTLTEKDFLSGLGEVVKFNIMYGEKGLSRLEKDMGSLLRREETTLRTYVERALQFKKAFIEEDEFDRGRRVLLNYGHTFGHAIETATHYAVPHGTAVAMGAVMANRISLSRGMLSGEAAGRMEKLLLSIIPYSSDPLSFPPALLADAARKDKKNIDSRLTAVLLHGDGTLHVVHDLQEREIYGALDALKALLDAGGR